MPEFTNLGLFFGIESVILDSENLSKTLDVIKNWNAKKPLIIRVMIPKNARSLPIVRHGIKLSLPIE